MIKWFYISIILISTNLNFSAQSDALYSQYMFNQFTVNPAYAGSRDALSTVLLYRNQWTGIDDAPKTVNFSLDIEASSISRISLLYTIKLSRYLSLRASAK